MKDVQESLQTKDIGSGRLPSIRVGLRVGRPHVTIVQVNERLADENGYEENAKINRNYPLPFFYFKFWAENELCLSPSKI